MAILDSLKKLGRKMTGGPVRGTDIESAIDSIANNYSGGGNDDIRVNCSYNEETETVTADKTFD